jgi:hypothetical protein
MAVHADVTKGEIVFAGRFEKLKTCTRALVKNSVVILLLRRPTALERLRLSPQLNGKNLTRPTLPRRVN